jgi:hypothetical protein
LKGKTRAKASVKNSGWTARCARRTFSPPIYGQSQKETSSEDEQAQAPQTLEVASA